MEASYSKADHELTIEDAEKLVAKISQEKLELTELLAQRTHDRQSTICWLDYRKRHERQLGLALSVERKKIHVLQLFLDKLCFANDAHHGKPMTPCLSAGEIAKHKKHFRIVHGTNSLAEEKQLLKEFNECQREGVDPFSPSDEKDYRLPWIRGINERNKAEDCLREIREIEWRSARFGILLQRQRDEAIANANADAAANTEAAADALIYGKIWNYLGSQKSLRDQIKLTCKEIDKLTKLLLDARLKIKQAEREVKVIEKDIDCLKKKLPLKDQRKDKAHQCIFKLRKQQSDDV